MAGGWDELGFSTQAGLAVALFAGGVFLLVARLTNRGPDRTEEVAVALGAGAAIVDVRSPAEFAGGHVRGAVNIPVGELGARLAEVPVDRLVVVYCASGIRSAQGARVLRLAGRTVVDGGRAASFPPELRG